MKRSNRMVHRQNVLVSSRKLQQRRHNKLRTSFQLIIEERWLLQTYSHLIKQLFLPQPLSERERKASTDTSEDGSRLRTFSGALRMDWINLRPTFTKHM